MFEFYVVNKREEVDLLLIGFFLILSLEKILS